MRRLLVLRRIGRILHDDHGLGEVRAVELAALSERCTADPIRADRRGDECRGNCSGEVVFDECLTPRERVVGWKAKWANGSAEDLATTNRTPACIPAETREEIARICLKTAALLGTDMAVRFDLRQQSKTGAIYIVDINPNPDLGSGSGFRKALDAAEMLFSDFLEDLIIAACARRSR